MADDERFATVWTFDDGDVPIRGAQSLREHEVRGVIDGYMADADHNDAPRAIVVYLVSGGRREEVIRFANPHAQFSAALTAARERLLGILPPVASDATGHVAIIVSLSRTLAAATKPDIARGAFAALIAAGIAPDCKTRTDRGDMTVAELFRRVMAEYSVRG